MLMDVIQPYIVPILQALVGMLVSIIIGAALSLRVKINKWLASKTNADQRELLHKLSLEAFAFAETVYKNENGPNKLGAAYGYLSKRASDYAIDISVTEIKAIIEKSVLDYNAGLKRDGAK